MSRERLIVAEAGDALALELPRSVTASWRAGTEVAATPFGSDAVLLVRADLNASGVLAATLSSFSVGDAFGYALSGVRTGKLVVTRGSVRKTVSFREGQVVFAQSTEASERLGTALVRLGLISRDQLAQALEQVKPGARLGQVLTRNGTLSPSRLYNAMTHVVREIVLNLFSETEGELLFLEGLPPTEDGLKLPESTRELAVEGLRRAEEVLRLKRAEDAAAPVRPEVPPVLERIRELVRTLCEALVASGEGIDSLRSFLSEPVPGSENAFEGVPLSEAGDLDVERVLENFGSDAAARARAYEALDAFVWYALFTARNVVSADEAERLTAELRRAKEGSS